MNIDEIRARAEGATPGPWEAREGDLEGKSASEYARTLFANREKDETTSGRLFLTLAANPIDPELGATVVPALTGDGPQAEANAVFIAHARTDVPALLTALDESRAEVARLTADLEAGDACGAVGCRAIAERDSLAAVVASVRELADGDLLVSPSELRAALAPDPSPTPAAPTAVEPTVVTSGDEASVGEATPCRCGTDATSLNLAEVVVHRADGPCYIAAALTPTTTETEDES